MKLKFERVVLMFAHAVKQPKTASKIEEIRTKTNQLLQNYQNANTEQKLEIETEIIELNKPLIHSICSNMKPKSEDQYDEFFAEGMYGLLLGIRNFDFEKGIFSVFAYKYIESSIKRFKYPQMTPISVPEKYKIEFLRAKKVKLRKESELEEELNFDEWANLSGIEKQKLMDLNSAIDNVVYFESQENADYFLNQISTSEKNDENDDQNENWSELKDKLWIFLKESLSDEDFQILTLFYVENLPFEEISEITNLTYKNVQNRLHKIRNLQTSTNAGCEVRRFCRKNNLTESRMTRNLRFLQNLTF